MNNSKKCIGAVLMAVSQTMPTPVQGNQQREVLDEPGVTPSKETLLPVHSKPVRTELPASVLAELMKPVDREVKTGRRTEKSKAGEKSFVFCVQSREDYYEKRVRKK
jgi:hypothetical protein